MEGEPLETARRRISQFREEVISNDSLLQLVRPTIITFSSQARVEYDGPTVADLQLREVAVGGSTRLDLGFALVQSLIAEHPHPEDMWEPLVFVYTDGRATDEEGDPEGTAWREARYALLHPSSNIPKPAAIVAIGCSPNITDAALAAISTVDWVRKASLSEAMLTQLYAFFVGTVADMILRERAELRKMLGIGGALGEPERLLLPPTRSLAFRVFDALEDDPGALTSDGYPRMARVRSVFEAFAHAAPSSQQMKEWYGDWRGSPAEEERALMMEAEAEAVAAAAQARMAAGAATEAAAVALAEQSVADVAAHEAVEDAALAISAESARNSPKSTSGRRRRGPSAGGTEQASGRGTPSEVTSTPRTRPTRRRR
jgi:hypothetical protein